MARCNASCVKLLTHYFWHMTLRHCNLKIRPFQENENNLNFSDENGGRLNWNSFKRQSKNLTTKNNYPAATSWFLETATAPYTWIIDVDVYMLSSLSLPLTLDTAICYLDIAQLVAVIIFSVTGRCGRRVLVYATFFFAHSVSATPLLWHTTLFRNQKRSFEKIKERKK